MKGHGTIYYSYQIRSDDFRTLHDATTAPCRCKCETVLSSIYSNSGCSLRRSRTTARSCGPPLPGGCGPLGPDGPAYVIKFTRSLPTAERMNLGQEAGLHGRRVLLRQERPFKRLEDVPLAVYGSSQIRIIRQLFHLRIC